MPKLPRNLITFADLFCGIGGFRIALESLGLRCMWSCDNDMHAQKVYTANFGDTPFGDIRDIDETSIPAHDILCAGFPCQSFSVAGNRKGFDDERGALFFDIIRVADKVRPKVVLLENVRQVASDDNLRVMTTAFDGIGYALSGAILDASHFGVPQKRIRWYGVAILRSCGIEWDEPTASRPPTSLCDSLLPDSDERVKDALQRGSKYVKHIQNTKLKGQNEVSVVGRLGNSVNNHGQGLTIYHADGVTTTQLAKRVSGENAYFTKGGVRRLVTLEKQRVMGFPDSFVNAVSPPHMERLLGGAVIPHMIVQVATELTQKECDMARLKNPKAKGNSFEREVAETLTYAFKEPFMRVPNSGAAVGGANAQRAEAMDARQASMMRGDIIPPASMRLLVIECKHRQEFSSFPPDRILSGDWAPLTAAIEQVLHDAHTIDDTRMDLRPIPMLVLKGNRTRPWIAMPKDIWNAVFTLRKFNNGYPPCVYYNMSAPTKKGRIRDIWAIFGLREILGDPLTARALKDLIRERTEAVSGELWK